MSRKRRWNLPPKYILIVCSTLCIALIILSFKYKEEFEPVKTSVGNAVTPMQKGINSIGRYVSTKMKLVTTMQTLLNENADLKGQLDTLSYENKVLQQEKYELDSLRELFKLDEKYVGYPKVAARVIGRDNNNWYNQFTIDKGSDDGLAKDNNVIAGEGLVGIITEVGKNYAKVRSIIDDDSYVSGMFLKTSDPCDVKGNLELLSEGVIGVERINKDAAIEDGYEVVTSHISDKYLQGILIGYISNIQYDATNLTKSAYLTPTVDFGKLDTVLVITQLKDATELEDVLKYDQTTNWYTFYNNPLLYTPDYLLPRN